jgi:DNA-binding NarL/FixJ family response regulator
VATPTQPFSMPHQDFSVPHQVLVRLHKDLQALVGETLERRNINLEHYLLQLIENDIAPLRLEKWRAKSHPEPRHSQGTIEVLGKRQKAAERARLILELSDQGLSPSIISERVHVSLNTVHRIRRMHGEST